MRAIMTCVDYSDLLSVTLPYNRHHFKEVWVVTCTRDTATQDIALQHCAKLHITDAFYDDGASFNKWKALEQGLDAMGRRGWLCIMDADVLWPTRVQANAQYETVKWWIPNRPTMQQDCGQLCTPLRRMCPDEMFVPEADWSKFPLHRNMNEHAGYSQVFHADDPALSGCTTWHELNWRHAGGADSFFQARWPKELKLRPPFECLHLGPAGTNWCGVSIEARMQLVRHFAERRRGGGFKGEKL